MSIGLAACTVAYAVPANAPGLELLLVGNTPIGEAHDFVDCHLSLQSIEDVLPPPVLHQVDALRTFSDQGSPPGKRDESIDSLDQICRSVEATELVAVQTTSLRIQNFLG